MELPPIARTDLDGPIAYRVWDGPQDLTFLLVHGLGGAHVNWVRVAGELAGLGRVVAPDLPGFGWSPRAGRATELMALRRWLHRIRAEIADGPIVLCGNSLGGAVAVLEAAIAPEQVAGLVLASSVLPWVRGALPHPAVVGAFAAYDAGPLGEALVRARLQRLSAETIVRIGLAITTSEAGSIPPDVRALQIDSVRERQRDPEAARAFVDAARSLLRLGRRPDVAWRAAEAIRCPVLLLHGRRDRLVPAHLAEATLRRMPTWRGRIWPGVGHAVMLEAPGRFLAEVGDWHAELIGRGRRS